MALREPVSRQVRRERQPVQDQLREFGRQHLEHPDELIQIRILKEIPLAKLHELRAAHTQAATAQDVQGFLRSPADPEPCAWRSPTSGGGGCTGVVQEYRTVSLLDMAHHPQHQLGPPQKPLPELRN
ncbi:hypothetical protein ACWGH4_13445 [Streptomyces sp. NPDC054847]